MQREINIVIAPSVSQDSKMISTSDSELTVIQVIDCSLHLYLPTSVLTDIHPTSGSLLHTSHDLIPFLFPSRPFLPPSRSPLLSHPNLLVSPYIFFSQAACYDAHSNIRKKHVLLDDHGRSNHGTRDRKSVV